MPKFDFQSQFSTSKSSESFSFFSLKNINLILHPSLENSTTLITIMEMEEHIDQLTCNAHSWAYALIKIIVKGQLLSLALQFILFSFITWPNLIHSTISSDWICYVLKGAVHKLCCLKTPRQRSHAH